MSPHAVPLIPPANAAFLEREVSGPESSSAPAVEILGLRRSRQLLSAKEPRPCLTHDQAL